MAGTRYVRYIAFAVISLIVIFFISSSSSVPGSSRIRSGTDKLQSIQESWRGHNPATNPESPKPVVDVEEDIGTSKSESPTEKQQSKLGAEEADQKQPPKKPTPDEKEGAKPTKERPAGKDTAQTPNRPPKLPGPKAEGGRMNATFVALARNSDVWEMAKSIRNVEDRFNHRFNYDWVFLNDKEFDETFQKVTSALTSGKTRYGLIPEEHWSFPDFIDLDKAAQARKELGEKKIIYGDSISYRHMCRYESGFFFRHPIMNEYEWYWRVEPSVELHCDINYDTFAWMAKHEKLYSFVISLYEYKETIPTIWDSVKKFMKRHPEHLSEDNMMGFISDDDGETYNHCHFWSNFEIANLNWLRSNKYLDFFEVLDKDGGFFYERWGDAPVHTLAAALTLRKDQIHFFEDIAYYHVPFTHCPNEEKTRLERKCHCNPEDNFDWNGYSCTARYYDVKKMKKPGWYEYQL